MFKQYYKKNPAPHSPKCVHMATLQKTAGSRCLRSVGNTVTPKEVGSHWSEALPLLPWEKRRARDTRPSLLLPLWADGRGDTAVDSRAVPLSASPSHSSSHLPRFLNIGIVQGARALLLSCMLCSYRHLPLVALPRTGPQYTASSLSRSVPCALRC